MGLVGEERALALLDALLSTKDSSNGLAVANICIDHVSAMLAALADKPQKDTFPRCETIQLVGATLGIKREVTLPRACDTFEDYEALNAFISKHTNGRFVDVVSPSVVRCIVSCCTQRETFDEDNEFNEGCTRKVAFSGGSGPIVEMMQMYGKRLLHFFDDGLQAVSLRYESGNRLIIVGHASRDARSLANEDVLRAWRGLSYGRHDCNLELPKHNITTQPHNVTHALMQYWQTVDPEMKDVFDRVGLDVILTGAHVETDEHGTSCEGVCCEASLGGLINTPREKINLFFHWPHYVFIQNRCGLVTFAAYVAFAAK